MKLFLSLVFAIVILINPGFAQYDDDDDNGGATDLVSFLGMGWTWGFEDARPFIETNYALGIATHDNMQRNFYVNGMVEAKIGYSLIDSFSRGIVHLEEKFISGSYMEKNYNTLIPQDETDLINEKMTRFGFGIRHGYGYNLGLLKIIPFTQHSFQWYKMKSERPENLSSDDIALLDRFEDAYRFGFTNEAGLKVRLFRSIDAVASYEYSVIYPRVVFPQWFVSYTLLYVSMGVVSKFSRDIVKGSPILGPLLYFALTNGLTWGYTYALKSSMHWPFDTEVPMLNNAGKIGVSISF
jgi:hypothetical protein